MEENFSKEESLKLINEMIWKAKNSHYESGIGPLLWGSVIFTCSMVSFIQIKYNIDIGFDIWWLTFIAVVPQVYITIKSKKQKNFKGYDDTAMNYVWMTFAISIALLIHYNTHIHHSGDSVPLFLILYGIPTIITAGIKTFKPMLFGGIVCWLAAIITVYTDIKIDLLLMALSALCAWFIPGIILRKRYLKLLQNKQPHGV
ncbi:MAG: hypothetical protein ABIQ07_10855 [Ginsengibacter sp.]